ncbi:hypothetical protein [uncultured Prevotella sp.]|jgi:hypothetical protein|uniref:hypothetical protein n=1 Tax=uncultured Prevotella sp. TaxID=159272 RepID=UPI00258E2F6F|nr:hypothetical protein [uncultured Prevotella sp.]
MKCRFIVKGYYEVAYFDIPVKADFKLGDKKYIRFSSYDASKIVFNFYKHEVCQGDKPFGSLISKTGFLDCGYKHWTQFEPFNKRIVYKYSVDRGIIEIEPLNIGDTYNIDNSDILDL